MKTFRALAVIIAIAIAMQLVIFSPSSPPDTTRFMEQARSLLAGQGFRTEGRLEVRLPPGYPVLLAFLLPLGGVAFIRFIQILLFAAAASLLYLALKPMNERRALVAAVVFAANPWLASRSGAILSETLGIFLSALLVWLLSRIERLPTVSACIGFGAVSVALILTSPASIVLSFLLFLYVAASRLRYAPATIGGALLLMIPWQVHSYRAIGRISPLVYTDAIGNQIEPWTRSWVLRESDLRFRWHPDEIAAAPRRAFATEAQRAELIDASRRLAPPQFIDLLTRTGREAAAGHPLRYYVGLPLLRAILLWVDMPQLEHAQMEYVGRFTILRDAHTVGWPRALLRCGKALLSTAGLAFYVGFPLAFAVVACLAVRRGAVVPLCILGGVLAYTLLSAWLAEGEARRNLVFYPALVIAAFYSGKASSHD